MPCLTGHGRCRLQPRAREFRRRSQRVPSVPIGKLSEQVILAGQQHFLVLYLDSEGERLDGRGLADLDLSPGLSFASRRPRRSSSTAWPSTNRSSRSRGQRRGRAPRSSVPNGDGERHRRHRAPSTRRRGADSWQLGAGRCRRGDRRRHARSEHPSPLRGGTGRYAWLLRVPIRPRCAAAGL